LLLPIEKESVIFSHTAYAMKNGCYLMLFYYWIAWSKQTM